MTIIYKQGDGPVTVTAAIKLVRSALPKEPAYDVYAQIGPDGDIDWAGPIETKHNPQSGIRSAWLEQDFLDACAQLGIQPKNKYRPTKGTLSFNSAEPDYHTITHQEFVRYADLYQCVVEVVQGDFASVSEEREPLGPLSLIVAIAGRRALPVRAIPYVTGWLLSPEELARQFARVLSEGFVKLQNSPAYFLDGDTPRPMLPKEWDGYVAGLKGREAELKAKHADDDIGYAVWRAEAVGKLPAGVFVWRDDFESDFARDFSPDALSYASERAGDRELTYAPMLEDEVRVLVLEGFKRARLPRPTPADAECSRGWYDETLSAASWWALSDLQPIEAAALLCEQDPHASPNPEETTTSETDPLDFRKLLRAFEDESKRDPRPRSLDDWRRLARARALKYHSWIDVYAEAVGADESIPAESSVSADVDYTVLASRKQLIEAFGVFTGMDIGWFKNVDDTPALKAARKVMGRGQRGSTVEPLFCPFEVMSWLVSPARKKGKRLGVDKGWELLEHYFQKAYAQRSVGDPR